VHRGLRVKTVRECELKRVESDRIRVAGEVGVKESMTGLRQSRQLRCRLCGRRVAGRVAAIARDPH
jgi:hypothetical protein